MVAPEWAEVTCPLCHGTFKHAGLRIHIARKHPNFGDFRGSPTRPKRVKHVNVALTPEDVTSLRILKHKLHLKHAAPRNREKLNKRLYPRDVSGVYAIQGPAGVYVGESRDCWYRGTLDLAVRLGLECGVVREVSVRTHHERANTLIRQAAEKEVVALFSRRGMFVVSNI